MAQSLKRAMALVLCLATLLAFMPAAMARKGVTITGSGSSSSMQTQEEEQETVSVLAATAQVTADKVNFREGPGTDYASLGRLAKGTLVAVLDNASYSGWWKVQSSDGKIGFVTTQYLRLVQVGAATETSTEKTSSSSETAASVVSAIAAGDPNKAKIESAKAKNKDTVGWIQVPGTNIDDPILYGANFYYATHNINKQKSYEGVYPFYNKLTKNVVIFGHNLRGSGKGFHDLHHMQETALGYSRCQSGSCGKSLGSKFQNWQADNRVWNISIYGKSKWEVFAMYEVKANEPKSTLRNNWSSLSGASSSTVQKWIDGQLKRSEVNFGVSVSPKDTFLTIITCGTNYDSATANSRLFVFLKSVG